MIRHNAIISLSSKHYWRPEFLELYQALRDKKFNKGGLKDKNEIDLFDWLGRSYLDFLKKETR